MNWSCPICQGGQYTRAVMSRADGQEYESQFHVCLGCSAVFIEPALFAGAKAVHELYPPKSSMAHEDSLERQSMERRFWAARAKRLSGMTTEPSNTVVSAMMRRGRLDER